MGIDGLAPMIEGKDASRGPILGGARYRPERAALNTGEDPAIAAACGVGGIVKLGSVTQLHR
jgi:hypothetical protein